MNSSVLKAITTPNMLTTNGLMAYSPIIAISNGMKDWNMRKDGVQPHHAVIGITGKSKNMMVVEQNLQRMMKLMSQLRNWGAIQGDDGPARLGSHSPLAQGP